LVAKCEFWKCSGLAEQPPAEQHEQEHRAHTPEGGQRAADEDGGVVGGEPRVEDRQRGGHELGHVQGERTVGEEVRVELDRVQRELGDGLRDPALVGMKVVRLVEVQAEETDGDGERERCREEPAEACEDGAHRPPLSCGS
jgi:hypothetical protein